MMDDTRWMDIALDEAKKAAALGEVPVGAVVVHDGRLISKAHNLRESQNDPTAHAEMLAIRLASQRMGSWRLEGAHLYVTLEPCAMCAGAIVLARLQRCVYAARDPKAGAVASLYQILSDPRLNHRPIVDEGIRADAASMLLKQFFQRLRHGRKQLDEVDS